MEHLFLMFLDHTQRRSTVGRSPLDEGSARRILLWCRVLSGRGLCDERSPRPEESYRLCCVVVCDLETSRMGAPYIYDIRCLRVNQHNIIVRSRTTGQWHKPPIPACLHNTWPTTSPLTQRFSTFVRLRPGKFFFHKTRAQSQKIYS